ncbi:hypothetical protein ACFWWT_35255 [Streptomyces sp. NPDC058676]|uniref:hypothetical protein n=1 Tax=unclassified Streptomyces TaxID=2593676 RepID=UPI00364692F6
MTALPVRRSASAALCAALLIGITGPAAMAADSAPERSHAAPPEARLPGSDAPPGQTRKLNATGLELSPVTDLLNAVQEADNGQLPAAEARTLVDAAKAALAEAAAKAPAPSATATVSTPAAGVLLVAPTRGAAKSRVAERRAADPTSDAQDAVEKALDDLLESVTSGDVSLVLQSIDRLLAEVENLVAALTDSDLAATTPPSTSTTPVLYPTAVTLPAVAWPTALVLPVS